MASTMASRAFWAFFLFPLGAYAATLPLQNAGRRNASPFGAKVYIPAGFNRTLFDEDFSSQPAGALPSTSRWAIDNGTSYPGGPQHWGTGEVQSYTNSLSNIAITPAGTLQITPLSTGGRWTSARIETTANYDFACAAGTRLRMEASLRMGDAAPGTQAGIWPAFWALGSAYRGVYHNWPAVGEIDIFESLNGAPTAWQTLHCGAGSGGPCHETTGISSTTAVSRGDWHVVAVEIDRTNAGGDWRGEKITWLVDGRPTTSVSGAVVGNEAAWEAVARSSKFLILNIAIGGDFPNAIARTTTPNSQTQGGDGAILEVKYVRVYST